VDLARWLEDWQDLGYSAKRARDDQREGMARGAAASVAAEALCKEISAEGLWVDSFWIGLIESWAREWAAYTGLDEMAALRQVIECDLPLKDIVGDTPLLDLTEGVLPPPFTLAFMRATTPIMLVENDPARHNWMLGVLARLRIDNVCVLQTSPQMIFQEMICRDQRPVREILRQSRHWAGLGSRWYLRRDREEGERRGTPLEEIFEIGKQRVLYYSGVPDEPRAVEVLTAASVLIPRIETEMKRLEMWSEDPPPLLEMADRGELKSYLDAPSFELWLQCVFLERAKECVKTDTWPQGSQVGTMALRSFDGREDTGDLQLALETFDQLVQQRNEGVGDRAVSLAGRLLFKVDGYGDRWPAVAVMPYDAAYFGRAIGRLSEKLALETTSGKDWHYVVDGARIRAEMGWRGTCSIEAETVAARDRIFHVLRLAEF